MLLKRKSYQLEKGEKYIVYLIYIYIYIYITYIPRQYLERNAYTLCIHIISKLYMIST